MITSAVDLLLEVDPGELKAAIRSATTAEHFAVAAALSMVAAARKARDGEASAEVIPLGDRAEDDGPRW